MTRGELVHPTHPTGVVPVRGGVIAAPPTRGVVARGGVIRRVWHWLGPPVPATYLGGSEYPVIARHQHWLVLARAIAMMVGGGLASIPLGWLVTFVAPGVWQAQAVFVATALIHQGYFGYFVLRWRSDLVVVTNLRLIRMVGIFRRQMLDISLGMIAERDCIWTVPGRLFGYGTLRVESAGSNGVRSQTLIRFLPHPLQVVQATLPIGRPSR